MRVGVNGIDQLRLLRRRREIDATLQNATAVSVRAQNYAMRSNGVVDALIERCAEPCQQLLDNVVAIMICRQRNQSLFQRHHHALHLQSVRLVKTHQACL